MVFEQGLDNDITELIKNVSSQMFEEDKLGKITKVYPYSMKGQPYVHECDVYLLSEDKELKHVQVAKTSMDSVSVPRKDDICIVSYEGLRNNTPFITSFVSISEPLDEDKPGEIGNTKQYDSIPAMYGDWRVRKWGDAEMAITRDVNPKQDRDRSDEQRETDDTIVKIGKHEGDFKEDEADFTDFEFGIRLNIEKGTIYLFNKNRDMGFWIDMESGEFKIGDGNQYGIESDGNGNFDWYFQNLDMHDDGTKLDWSDIE